MGQVGDLVNAIPALTGRVHTAAKLSELMQRNQLPQWAPAAFELPLGLRGGAADAATGLFRQELQWFTGVVLVVRSAGDATGEAGLVELAPLIDAVIHAVAGVDADNGFGTYTLSRGELLSLAAGTLVYQLDFTVDDQLRIPR